MTQNRRTLRAYCRRACSALPGCWKEKKYFARHLRGSAEAFLAEHPDAGMGELEAALGEPEDLTAAFVESAGTGGAAHPDRPQTPQRPAGRRCVRGGPPWGDGVYLAVASQGGDRHPGNAYRRGIRKRPQSAQAANQALKCRSKKINRLGWYPLC